MQITGLHLHIPVDGGTSDLHGTLGGHDETAHLPHEHDSADHDEHAVEIDISLLKQFANYWSKLVPFLLIGIFVLLLTPQVTRIAWLIPRRCGKPRQRTRWRPPLRAPPSHI